MTDFAVLGFPLGLAVLASAVAIRFPTTWVLTRRRADRIFAFSTIAFGVVLTALPILRFLAFKDGDIVINSEWDLAIFDQAVWNSLHGRLLENSVIPDAPQYLGKSFAPILLAFVPLYAIHSSPVVLLIVQSLGLVFAALPLYGFARQRLQPALALCIALAYLLYPGLHFINLTQFHEIALETPLLALALFFLLRTHYAGFLVTLGVALLVKEEVAFVAFAFGMYVLFAQRERRLGLALIGASALWAYVALQFVIPYFRGEEFGGGFYYFSSGATGGGAARYGWLGKNIGEIAATLVSRPDFIFQNVVTPEKIEFVLQLLVPLAFVPLVGAEIAAIALPTLGYTLLSQFLPQTSIRFFYFAPIIPFLFFSAIVGIERLRNWNWRQEINGVEPAARRRREIALAVLILVASVSNYALQSPLPLGRFFEPRRYDVNAHAARGNALLASIPRDKVVASEMDLMGHLSNRQFIYEIPALPSFLQTDYLVADATSGWYDVHKGIWDRMLATGFFEIETRDGFLIATRKPPESILNARVSEQLTLVGWTTPVKTIRGGTTYQPIVYWRAETKIAEHWTFLAQVTDAQEHVWAEVEQEPQEGQLPTTRWEIGKLIGDQYLLHLPPTMPSGEYSISVSARRASNGGDVSVPQVMLARVWIEKNKESFTANQLQIPQPLFVDMQELRFLGFVPPRQTISAGELLQVGLYWRAREKPRGDYIVAVQLRDAQARVAFEHSARPANGTYATTQWNAGEVLLDWHDFTLPREIPSGTYDLHVVAREAVGAKFIGETFLATITVGK